MMPIRVTIISPPKAIPNINQTEIFNTRNIFTNIVTHEFAVGQFDYNP